MMPGDRPTERMSTLSPGARQTLRLVGAVLLVGGIAMVIGGFVGFANAGSRSVSSFGADRSSPVGWMVLFMLGGVVASAGAWCLRLGFLKAAADIVSTETAGAVEHSSAALGRGVGRGLQQSGAFAGDGAWGGRGREVVKVKCRGCGFLEMEDARFCSKCSKPI